MENERKMMKKPPSRIKYEKSHPIVNARLDKETREKLKKMVKSEGKSLSAFLKNFVNKNFENWSGAYQKGYEKGRKDFQLWFYCSICNEKVVILPKSDGHKYIAEQLRNYGAGHSNCLKRKDLISFGEK